MRVPQGDVAIVDVHCRRHTRPHESGGHGDGLHAIYNTDIPLLTLSLPMRPLLQLLSPRCHIRRRRRGRYRRGRWSERGTHLAAATRGG